MSENKIGEIIKKNRIMRGCSQADLAKAIGVAPSALAAYESGKRVPKIEVREQIATVLGVDKVEMSGIELSEVDEKRLLLKLINKYAKTVERGEQTESGKSEVNVVLPDDFEDYVKQVELKERRISGVNEVIEGEELDEATEKLVNDIIADACYQMEYWLALYPEYTYERSIELLEKNNMNSIIKKEDVDNYTVSRSTVDFITYKQNSFADFLNGVAKGVAKEIEKEKRKFSFFSVRKK